MVTSFHAVKKWLAAVFLLAALTSFGLAAEVDAQLDRESVPAGNGAMLTIRISGGRAEQPQIPEIPNFIVEPRGQSQQFQMSNGQTTISVTYNFVVGSQTPGDYEIPSLEVMVDGKKFTTQPLKLKVLADSASQPPAGANPNPATQQPAPGDPAAAQDQFGFLKVTPLLGDRKYVYVGEIAPVRIQAWIPQEARAQLRSGIQPEGKAFTLHNVNDQPQQTEEIKDGKRYIVVTWYGGISATKAGNYPASLSLKATVAVRDQSAPAPRRRRGGPFDDPFFDSAFDQMNARYIEKDVNLTSQDQEIEVRALPTEGRPAGFTGAVGKFRLESPNIPSTWQTGEPQQISGKIAGEGNFALMNAPELTPAEIWKVYPGKDEFTPGDQASFSGSKQFQFSAVPRKGGTHEVGLSFSYFDPTAGEYKTVTSPPKQIQVTGADLVEQKTDVPAETTPAPRKGDNLVGQHLVNTPVRPLTPLVSRPAFIEMLTLGALLTILGRVLSLVRKRRSEPARLARIAVEKATREALAAAGERAAASDVSGFFAAARLAIQQRLGLLWNQPAQAITLAEINERIPNDSPVAEFFREADLYEYSPHSTAAGMFPTWQQQLDHALESLTPVSSK